MCGIAGRFHSQHLPHDPMWRQRANTLLAHRGPDGEGVFADEHCELVHRRLALIDLSPTGHQPMTNEDGTIQVIFNGEIYNHQELRAQLLAQGHSFRGTSDTEVLVHLYEQHGAQMVERLRGMFAFAIYDQPRRRLLLARDRFGIKPLYYTMLGNQLAFASEIKALLALDGFQPTIDRQACYDFLGLSYIPEPQTAFAEIRALPPGHALLCECSEPRLIQYHHLQAQADESLTLLQAAAAAADSLQQAVAAQSVADVQVAALLSGGIDSSLVVAAYCRTTNCRTGGEALTTFNVSFPDARYDETPMALAVSRQYQTRHHTISAADWTVTPELAQRLLLHFDQPFADTSLIPTYWVSRAIHEQDIICALSGDGGDEAYGGYACFWRANRLMQLARMPKSVQNVAIFGGQRLAGVTSDLGRQLAKAVRLAQAGGRDGAVMLANLASYLDEEQKREVLLPEAASQLVESSRHFNGHQPAGLRNLEDLSRRLTETHFRVNLPSDMLRKVDMMSMLASIEVRVPMLDEEMVAQGLALPHRLKTDGHQGKLVLRETARQWLPSEVVNHRKMGFSIPMDRLATAAFHEMLADLLLAADARIRTFLDLPLIESWLRQFKAAQDGKQQGQMSREGLYQRIFMILALELWLRQQRLSW